MKKTEDGHRFYISQMTKSYCYDCKRGDIDHYSAQRCRNCYERWSRQQKKEQS